MQVALRLALVGLLSLSIAGPLREAHAQEAGAAALTVPLPGATVSGVVAILGTAAHPRFQRYELAFGYDPDPTDTWFTIQEPVPTPMPAGLLGRWDTTHIADGLYVLRLRVYTSDREYIETLVRGVRVQNLAPDSPPPIVPSATATNVPAAAGSPAAPVHPTATAPLIALPSAPTARPTAGAGSNPNQGRSAGAGLSAQALSVAFGAGIQLTIVLFALLGAYQAMRAAAQAILRRLRR